MPTLASRPQLTPDQVEEFFKVHLPYRLAMLTAHRDHQVKGTLGSYQRELMVCMFEAGLIACRVLLQFLGLGVKYRPTLHLVEDHRYWSYDGKITDEIKVVDLGGSFVNVGSLSLSEAALLASVIDGASKSSAHLTYQATAFDWREFHPTVGLVERLLRTQPFDVVERPMALSAAL